MILPIGFSIVLGLFCIFIAPKYYAMIGFRGALFILKIKNSWALTNRVFGFFLLISGLIPLVTSNLTVYFGFIVIALLSTDLISYLILAYFKKHKRPIM